MGRQECSPSPAPLRLLGATFEPGRVVVGCLRDMVHENLVVVSQLPLPTDGSHDMVNLEYEGVFFAPTFSIPKCKVVSNRHLWEGDELTQTTQETCNSGGTRQTQGNTRHRCGLRCSAASQNNEL